MEKTLAKQVIIIGGGASGTLLGCQLLKGAAPKLRVTLIERREDVGRGVAYSTSNPAHLLNVPAVQLTAVMADGAVHRGVVVVLATVMEFHSVDVPQTIFVGGSADAVGR